MKYDRREGKELEFFISVAAILISIITGFTLSYSQGLRIEHRMTNLEAKVLMLTSSRGIGRVERERETAACTQP